MDKPVASENTDADVAHRQDVEWVRSVRQGDTSAYAYLVDRHGPVLHRTLRRFFRDDADVEDVLQEALVRAFKNLDRYDPTREFYPWLRKIAVNLALNELDKRKRRHEVSDEALAERASGANSDADLRAREVQTAVDRALDDLPPAWAAVFRLRNFEELSYAEIAATLDVPMGTVMSQLARARARLAEALAQTFGPREGGTP